MLPLVHSPLLAAILLIGGVPTARALGINCRGSSMCTEGPCGQHTLVNFQAALQNSVNSGHGGDFYNEGG